MLLTTLLCNTSFQLPTWSVPELESLWDARPPLGTCFSWHIYDDLASSLSFPLSSLILMLAPVLCLSGLKLSSRPSANPVDAQSLVSQCLKTKLQRKQPDWFLFLPSPQDGHSSGCELAAPACGILLELDPVVADGSCGLETACSTGSWPIGTDFLSGRVSGVGVGYWRLGKSLYNLMAAFFRTVYSVSLCDCLHSREFKFHLRAAGGLKFTSLAETAPLGSGQGFHCLLSTCPWKSHRHLNP